ncbi:MAG: SufD family Fe-S cluster assembly protein [Patescibacteria group bacterium]
MKILDTYKDKNAFRYGLKISSPFEDEFRLIVAKGAEVIDVKPETREVYENNLKKSRFLVVHVHEGAEFEYIETADGEASAKSDIHIFLIGARGSAKITARYDLSGVAQLDILHKIYHQAPDTASEIETRGVLRDKSYAIYRSDIVMEKGMKDLSGAESGKFLALSREAKVDAIPSLDIASNRVACSHSLSITHITPEDLFYSKTRGIGEDEAKDLLIDGFLQK